MRPSPHRVSSSLQERTSRGFEMFETLPHLDQHLLNDFQRDVPICKRPFEHIADKLGVYEGEVIERLNTLQEEGMISRFGATIRPNTIGASTLAALNVPEERIEEVANLVGSEPGVNHSYLREHEWNLWFVVAEPDRESLNETLNRIERRSGLKLLDLRLVRPFNIDLGFSLTRSAKMAGNRKPADLSVLTEEDRPLLDRLSRGLAIVERPFLALATDLDRSEAEMIERLNELNSAGIMTRFGVIVRHRSIGWKSNAMVVWQVPETQIEEAGNALASHPGVTLCYQRNTVEGLWPFTLFSMLHARSRDEALEVLQRASRLPALNGIYHEVLFSTQCFKQTGAILTKPSIKRGHHETRTLAS